MSDNAGVTVGQLKMMLASFDDDAEVFMGGLKFYRFKSRGDKLVQLEFHEQVYKDGSGKIVVQQFD